jgi:monothiol glutaredoxin
MMDDNNFIDVTENIKSEIKSNDVVLFMKGTPVFPMCGFSAATVQVLTNLGVKFNSINVLESDEMREGIKKFSNWPTIPQLYIKEEFIGGCDIVKEMFESGELLELLNTRGIEVNPT